MAHKLDYPKSESELRRLQDEMYRLTREALEKKDLPRFKDLLKIISSETVILTAIHKIKANQGSQTPGTDGETMRDDILEKDYPEVISRVQKALTDYRPKPVRRVFIPKPGKSEKRPLGIPAIIDRVIQECVKIVIEPILEAQFAAHSYGFRPLRDAHMALERTTDIIHKTGYHWVIEGDISKFFDNVNHTRLIKKLWHMGIRDRRALMIIKAMLKAGIMGELKENPLGTPQGGIISPLLANAYLDTLDQWIIREWEEKETRTEYGWHKNKITALRKRSGLKPAYLVRYADDWVLITSSKSNAEKWKKRIAKYLGCKLKLILSEDKTTITDIREKPIHFLGFTYKVVKGTSRTGYVSRTKPDPDRLKAKVKEIRRKIKELKKFKPKTKSEKLLVDGINQINSIIRGVIQYYQAATWVNPALSKYANSLQYTSYKAIKTHGGKWTIAKDTNNLMSVHSKYETQIPAIKHQKQTIGITYLGFCKWKKTELKNQDETPYTHAGREKYSKRTCRKPLTVRADELLTTSLSEIIAKRKENDMYNFEYYLNRPYAFNRDKGKCRICDEVLWADSVHTHHVNPKLPLNQVNRVPNLASICKTCHNMVHSKKDYSSLNPKTWNKIQNFRHKLEITA